jgi:peptide deformylase
VGRLITYLETTARQHGGLGIAAVQVGIPVRLVLLRRRHGQGGDHFQPFFNPHISYQSRRQIASWENGYVQVIC